jgi:hypothetical protein
MLGMSAWYLRRGFDLPTLALFASMCLASVAYGTPTARTPGAVFHVGDCGSGAIRRCI